MTGYEYTIADIAIYNELQNIFAFTQEPSSEEFKNVHHWMRQMDSISVIRSLSLNLKEDLQKLNAN